MSQGHDASARPRRERSARYPGVPLEAALELCRAIDERGLDGLPAGEVASGLGYSSIKTNTFSAGISAARQFGLMTLDGDGYALTPLAKSILHPADPAALPRLHREALLRPPLYAALAQRLADRRVPEPAILANVLYHHHQITASAKDAAAEAFLDSARFAGALADDGIFRPEGSREAPPEPAPASPMKRPAKSQRRADSSPVRLDLQLWGPDAGKVIRLRAPESIGRDSFERFLQAFRLLVRIEEED